MGRKLRFPIQVRCKHCDQVIYGCTCCVNFNDPHWDEQTRYGTYNRDTPFRFGHDNCLPGVEHEVDQERLEAAIKKQEEED